MTKNNVSIHRDDCKPHKHILLNINVSLSQFPISWIPKIPIATAAPPDKEREGKSENERDSGFKKWCWKISYYVGFIQCESLNLSIISITASAHTCTLYSASHLDASCHTKHCYASLWTHFPIQPTPVSSPKFPDLSPFICLFPVPWDLATQSVVNEPIVTGDFLIFKISGLAQIYWVWIYFFNK